MAKEIKTYPVKKVKIVSNSTGRDIKIYNKEGNDIVKGLGIANIDININVDKINTAVLTLINVDVDVEAEMVNNIVCPDCKELMVKTHIQNEEGDWYIGWLCGCKSEGVINE